MRRFARIASLLTAAVLAGCGGSVGVTTAAGTGIAAQTPVAAGGTPASPGAGSPVSPPPSPSPTPSPSPVTPPTVGVPAAPVGLQAAAGNGEVSIAWSAVAGAASYAVKRSATSGGPYVTVGTPTSVAYVDAGLTNGNPYYYVVAAVAAGGTSADSAEVHAVPLPSNTAVAAGTYFIVNIGSGLVVGAPGSAGGTAGNPVNLQQAAATGSSAQQWTVAALADGSYQITNVQANQPMQAQVPAGSSTPVQIAPADGGAHQHWILTPSGIGAYAMSPANGAALSMAVPTGAVVGSAVQLAAATAAGGAAEEFELVSVGSDATVIVNAAAPGIGVSDRILGVNMVYWYDPAQPSILPAFKTAGIKTIRWPGGSGADAYHWETNSLCPGSDSSSFVFPASQFPGSPVAANAAGRFIADLVAPADLDVSITVNYGTNAACTGPGDPAEAAAWVAASKSNGGYVSHWTVGNEVYGSYEADAHTVKHDPTTYANAVATGYYPQMKAADPTAQVGVVVLPGFVAASGRNWDATVLAQATYDFVEYHFYAQAPGTEDDAYLVGRAAQTLGTQIVAVKRDLAAAGRPDTPIYVGELGSTWGGVGVQGTSITQALYAGQVLGELMNAGVTRATWWLGYGGCSAAGGLGNPNFSNLLYGWQDFGGYMLFSDGLPENGCSAAPQLAAGTLLPTARAFQLFAAVAVAGEHVLGAAVAGDALDVRAYAATHGTGETVALFNTNQTLPKSVLLAVPGVASAAAVTVQTYDKAIYDLSKQNTWAAPAVTSLGSSTLPLALTLTPWSMTVVTVQP